MLGGVAWFCGESKGGHWRGRELAWASGNGAGACWREEGALRPGLAALGRAPATRGRGWPPRGAKALSRSATELADSVRQS